MGLRLLDGELGIQLDGVTNHWLADNHFAGAHDEDKAFTPFDYDTIKATVAWASDEYLTVTDETIGDITIEREKTLIIDIPECQAWYRLASTVTDVEGGALTTTAAAGELRNDRARLAAVVAMAKAWYSRPRAAVTIDFEEFFYDRAAGEMLAWIQTSAGAIEVNTTITRILWDGRSGRTTIQTDFSELDFLAVAGGKRSAGTGLVIPALAAPDMADKRDNLPVRSGSGAVGFGSIDPFVDATYGIDEHQNGPRTGEDSIAWERGEDGGYNLTIVLGEAYHDGVTDKWYEYRTDLFWDSLGMLKSGVEEYEVEIAEPVSCPTDIDGGTWD
jgi:hypothetical protein